MNLLGQRMFNQQHQSSVTWGMTEPVMDEWALLNGWPLKTIFLWWLPILIAIAASSILAVVQCHLQWNNSKSGFLATLNAVWLITNLYLLLYDGGICFWIFVWNKMLYSSSPCNPSMQLLWPPKTTGRKPQIKSHQDSTLVVACYLASSYQQLLWSNQPLDVSSRFSLHYVVYIDRELFGLRSSLKLHSTFIG